MPVTSLKESIRMLRHPVLWIPGFYAGILVACTVWLGFSGETFISGKLMFLGAALFPLFVAGALSCLSSGSFTPASFIQNAPLSFFRVLMPVIITIGIIFLLLFLVSIPFAIAGLGNDPAMISGLFIGITVPVIVFSLFADNVAISEGQKAFDSLKRSYEIVSRSFLPAITYIIVSIVSTCILGLFFAMIWGMVLSDRFTQYIDLSVAEQQKVFSGFGIPEWQNILGPDGILISAITIGLFFMVLIPFLIVYKQQCYLKASSFVPEVVISGEYDAKGRWYKY
ncbi:MAG TPA: hypothetical protein VN372_02220 [Methanospirillum sp.]|nr:hypothetical protein [Methanospirillum sp.]